MTEYHVQKGDTIAEVTRRLNTGWQTIRKNNPDSIGKAKNGNWFLKEGATITTGKSFAKTLIAAQKETPSTSSTKAGFPPPESAKPRYSVDKFSSQTAGNKNRTITHTIQAGDTLWNLAVKRYHVHVQDIIRDNDIIDPKKLKIGREITINLPKRGKEKPVVASWYGKDFHGKPMANGEIYDMHAATIAHKKIPLGTRVELKNTETGETVRAVVTDRGPYIQGRDIDLSYGLAQKLSLVEKGVGRLIMRIL